MLMAGCLHINQRKYMSEPSSASKILLVATGHMHPEHAISNQFFESLDIESAADWVHERTGIKNRFSVLPSDTIRKLRYKETSISKLREENALPSLAEMTEKPWQMAIERSPHKTQLPIDLVICGTSVPDFNIPAQASLIAKHLNIQATSFDVNSACSSFVTDLSVARSMLLSDPSLTTAAIFNPERYTLAMDFSDRKSCVLFGDGAACSILTKSSANSLKGLELLDIVLHSDPSGANHVIIPVDGHFFQNGSTVQKFAISKTLSVTHEILERNHLSASDLKFFIGHQANLRMLQSVAEKLGLSESQHLHNVEQFGNQGAAGAPCVLSTHWEKFKKGDYIVISVVGSGLTWGSALLRCT